MIIVKAPLRLSIAGGGTDLPSYYSKYGSDFISVAINKYVYIALSRSFTKETTIKYSEFERVSNHGDIKHPIFREVLNHVYSAFDIASFADIPSGTGLGSSGSFTVALLQAIQAACFPYFLDSKDSLADSAFYIEANKLGYPVGKQDHYIAAIGGLTHFNIKPNGDITSTAVPISIQQIHKLQNSMMLFFTGYSRNANDLLKNQDDNTIQNDTKTITNLRRTHALTAEAARALFNSDINDLALIFNEQFLLKRNRISNSTSPEIEDFYHHGLKNGALGGKLVGAGGGGFLLFITEDRDKLKHAMEDLGLKHVPFEFDYEGVKVVLNED